MIICSSCGYGIEDYQVFCGECGARNPLAPQPVTPIPPPPGAYSGAAAAAPPNPYHPFASPPLPPGYETSPVAVAPVTRRRWTGFVVAIVALFAVVAIAAAVYFALSPNNEADRIAENFKTAVERGTLVSPSGGGDAYEVYTRLRSLDPGHKTLGEMTERARPKLAEMGDQIFRQKEAVAVEKLTDADWQKASRLYKWLGEIEPGDQKHRARSAFADAELAKSARNIDGAESKFAEASRLDASWALPQNSLGLLRAEKKRWADAIPYYQNAIRLRNDWVIPYNNTGTAYFYLKQYDEATTWYNRVVQMNPEWGRPYLWLGRISKVKGYGYDACNYFRKAQGLDTSGTVFTDKDRDELREELSKCYGY